MPAPSRWPTLISLWSAATGLAIGIFPVANLLQNRGSWQSYPERLIAFVAVMTIAALLVLSIFIYLGRLWARRALVAVLCCFVLTIFAFIAVNDWRIASHDFTRVAVYILILAPPLFVLGVLFEPDVVRAFPANRRSLADKKSNQSAGTEVSVGADSSALATPRTLVTKFLIASGAIFIVLILLGAIGLGIAAFKGAELDKESKAYVDAAVPAIVSSWDKQELLSRASPEFDQATRPGDLERFFQNLRPLGRMQKYQGSQGQSVTSRILGKGMTISADYLAKAEFQTGTAKIYVKLIKHGNRWQISGFRVDPDYKRGHPSEASQRTPKVFASRPRRAPMGSFCEVSLSSSPPVRALLSTVEESTDPIGGIGNSSRETGSLQSPPAYRARFAKPVAPGERRA